MPDNHTTAKVARYPDCDVCGREAHYDAKSLQGPWGNFCDYCFPIYTNGKLGLGIGQRLVVR